MSGDRVELLFDEYALRHARGERPDVTDFLERAGDEREALGRLIDCFLETAPVLGASEEEIVIMQALVQQEPPVLVLRRRRKLGRSAVVSALIDSLHLDPGKHEKVAGYYHELEVGLLDPAGVGRAVWQALAELYSANVERLARTREGGAGSTGVVYLRAERTAVAPVSVAAEPSEPPDEIDRLFTAGG